MIDRERRLARPAGIAAIGVLVFVIASIVIQAGVDLGDTDLEADRLQAFDENSATLTLAAFVSGLGYGLVALPLFYLFRAAQARSERIRGGLIGIVVAGPLFLAAAIVIQAFAFDAIASDFVATDGAACMEAAAEGEDEQDQCVEDLITEDTAFSISTGLSLAGSLGLLFGLIYTSLNAMRVGLLTRFVGTLGMAVGVASLFFGPPFAALFMIPLGMLFLGFSPGGKPPAWDAGEAIPWPAPGQKTPSPTPEEPVEGRADEIYPDAAADEKDEDRPEPGSIADEVDRASRKAGGPQKRKRRG